MNEEHHRLVVHEVVTMFHGACRRDDGCVTLSHFSDLMGVYEGRPHPSVSARTSSFSGDEDHAEMIGSYAIGFVFMLARGVGEGTLRDLMMPLQKSAHVIDILTCIGKGILQGDVAALAETEEMLANLATAAYIAVKPDNPHI